MEVEIITKTKEGFESKRHDVHSISESRLNKRFYVHYVDFDTGLEEKVLELPFDEYMRLGLTFVKLERKV